MKMLPAILVLAEAAIFGVIVPLTVMRALVPSLVQSPVAGVTNYRGRRVVYGLGVVWLVWAGCALAGGAIAAATGASGVFGLLSIAGLLALMAFAFGLVDDSFGSSDAKGFRGHVGAALSGRLTTGGLKLLGIGTASLMAALYLGWDAPWGGSMTGPNAVRGWVGGILAGASIALTSNFLNLMDLRPGRALKTYAALAATGVLIGPLGLAWFGHGSVAHVTIVEIVALWLFVMGPVVATWRYDLGEVGMLGDAGANPMGAVAGLFIVAGLPLWALVVYFLAMLALNMTSEKVSFSAVIEANPMLARLDALGRHAPTGPPGEEADDDAPGGARHE